jgi:hypothetical protein
LASWFVRSAEGLESGGGNGVIEVTTVALEAAVKSLLFSLGIIAVTAATGAPAQAQNYPWCASYDTGDEAHNCGFVSYEQCMATVRGIGGFCEVNTQYQPLKPAKRH